MSAGAAKLHVTVTEVAPVNALVTRFSFARSDGGMMPTFSGGAHTVVEMQDAGTHRLNPYSLMSDPGDRYHPIHCPDQTTGGNERPFRAALFGAHRSACNLRRDVAQHPSNSRSYLS